MKKLIALILVLFCSGKDSALKGRIKPSTDNLLCG